MVATLLSACGGGGGGDSGAAASAALAVISSAPSSNETGVALDATISAVASRNLSPASLTNATFSVTAVAGGPVVGTIAVVGPTATFAPAVPLTPNTQYVATLSTGVTDSAGSPLPAVFMLSFTTLGPPGAPTNIIATAGNGQATVSFTPPASNGGAAITSYTVTSNPGGITATMTGSPIVITGLTNGTPYTFTVTANNIAGSGPPPAAPSNSVTPDPVAAAPPAPTIGTATASSGQASVAFTPPTCTLPTCPAISSYVVTSSPGGIAASGGASPIVVSGLTNGTAYTFSATAFNSAGPSPASAASNAVTPAGLPGAPTAASAFAGNALATVSFTPPASNGGSAITLYTVTSNPGGITATGGTSPIVVPGLINGTAYTFTVTATNSIGIGPASLPSTSTTPTPGVTVPGAPTAASAAAGNAQATVSFTAPASNGGAAILSYTVTSSPGGLSASGGASPIVVPGLTNGTAYTFSVAATNSAGTGAPSTPSNSVTPATIPGVPTSPAAVAGNSQATVSFTAPVSNGGSAITLYTVTSNPSGITATGGASPIVVSGLTNGVGYTFTVTASNVIGTGGPSVPTGSVTPAVTSAPGAPTAASAVAGNALATVSFTPPASNGGSAITGYTVTSNPGGVTAAGGASPIVVPGLTNGTVYVFTVTATNSIGTGPASGASNPIVPATVPGAPVAPSATAGNAQATVSFTPPASNGGAAITSYTVTSTPGSIVAFGSASPIVVTGLTNGIGYTFTVAATNSVGTGPNSVASNGAIPNPANTVSTAPTGVTATAPPGVTQANVTFSTPASTGGSAIQGYTVTSIPAGGTDLAAGTLGLTHTVSGLTAGTAYTFTVTALNGVGTSAPSGASNSVTPTVAPGAPTAVTATGGNAQATVSFTPPASNGGAAITSYTVNVCSPGCVVGPTGAASPIVVPGLVNGTTYNFTVTATTSAPLTGPASVASNFVTPNPTAAVPPAPTGASAFAGSSQQATVSFTAPACSLPSCTAITGYTVTSIPAGGVDTNAGDPNPAQAHLITGLTNGTAYTFTVAATNSVGTGPSSGASNTVTPVTNPGAPTAVTAVAGNALATVSFTPPASNGGAGIISYRVNVLVGAVPTGQFVIGAASPIVVNALTNGTAYTFTVSATNSSSLTGPDSVASGAITPTSATVSTAPTGASAAAGNGQVSVSFTSPPAFTSPGCALPACAPITSFTVTSNPGGFTAPGAASPLVVTGLTNGTAYTFTVTATNAIGVSPASAPTGSATPVGAPGAPTAVNAVAGNTQATVSFTPPASNGGAAITSYTVTSSPGNIIATGATSPITYPAASLTNGTPYTFTVTATNIAGTSAPSAASNSVIPTALATACSPTTPVVSGAISLRAQAARVTGVSPLAVFFDATATTSSATTRPFHEIEYRWDFGESVGSTAGAVWTTGSRANVSSKNLATGPLSSHVYDLAPGDFTSGSATRNVTLTATDGTSTATCSMQIIVTDPDVAFAASTLCVAPAAGQFAGCPVGATQLVQPNFTTAINTNAGQGATFKRILFRGGSTFTSSNNVFLTASGPGLIGTFPAVGAKAVIAGATSKFVLGTSGNNAFGDWRIVNLDLDGINRTVNTKGAVPVGAANRITFLDCIFRNLFLGFELEVLFLDFINTSSQIVPIWNEWALVGNQFINNFEYSFLGVLNRSAALGNRVAGQQAQHAWRLVHGSKNVISNNEFTGTPTGTAMTFRGLGWDPATRGSGNQFTLPANSYAEYSISSDNLLISGPGALPHTYAASNGTEHPRFRDHISERNMIVTDSPGLALTTVAGMSTIRNNLLVNTSTTDLRTIEVQPPEDPVITNFFVYNNSVFSGAVTSSTGLCIVDVNFGPVPNLVARNNLGVAPGNTNGQTAAVCDFVAGGFTGSNNSTSLQIRGASPLTTTPPTQPSHWRPQAATYPINNGFAAPVFSDFFAVPRTGNHIGAVNP